MPTSLPPKLSALEKGSLKSPAITQGMLSNSVTFIKLFHGIDLSTNLGLA